MSNLEAVFFWISMTIYCAACGGYIYAIVFQNPRPLRALTGAIVAGVLFHTLAIAARYAAQGHLPWSGHYEYALMGGWFIMVGSLLVGWRNSSLQVLAVVTVPLVILMLGYGYMTNPVLAPMAASLKSYWLYIHVYFAWLSFGAYSLAMAAGVLFLLKARASSSPAPVYERFPSLERLDELIFRYIIFGFITDSLMLVAGALWAKDLWGSYWNWDPVETWSLISYLTYGVTIHLRVTLGWREKRMAWLSIAALTTVIISFFGVNLMVNTSLHVFQVR